MTADPRPGLYVHVPFCSRRCPYCDFYSVSALDLIPRYLEQLAREAALAAGNWPGPFETLYLGGGSPSLLNGEGLGRLKEALAPLDLSQLEEFTLEANPEDVSPDQADRWAEAGVTRVSLGLQSLDERWLGSVLGRVHSLEDSFRAVEILKGRSYALSVDLIYGLPSQRLEDWGAELSRAAELSPDHISAYTLTVAPGTALARSVADKLLPPPPAPDRLAEFFELTGQALAGYGYEQYEVSNFARPERRSRHNLKYWRREPYLGLGPAAHSFDGRSRWGNVASVRRWISALEAGDRPLDFIEELDDRAARLETLMLGLRLTEGLPEEEAASPRLNDFLESGHLARSNGRVRPTVKGLLAADRLAVELS